MNITKTLFIRSLIVGTLLVSSISNYVNAKDIAIYRWVDENNVVHFSQNLPHGHDYTELSTVSSFKALSKAERAALEGDELTIEDQQEVTIAKNKEIFEKNCKAALLNIKMLNSLDEVHLTEEQADGKIINRPLTPQEKSSKLALSKKHEELYCTK
ncbi:DUF4124 domain-containing protein [Colwellia sp. E2M01]|uniref:DUF4124 domain-containing protein n=1 Tax=Colwellia sp. E2M01 TaxID=2841561 RepID=UPI001C0A193F|nr:DUF4124 domain-containing protein [Colwellia sp. E2M01]MBU2869155.1 DUF4124 domain-containing protein [Colwellia sp. E2M01]